MSLCYLQFLHSRRGSGTRLDKPAPFSFRYRPGLVVAVVVVVVLDWIGHGGHFFLHSFDFLRS